MKVAIITLSFALILGSCKNKNDYYEAPENGLNSVTASPEAEHPGKKLMETHCYVCHTPDKPGKQSRIAPPMAMVQSHYIDKNTAKEAFKKDFITFLENPSEDIAKMPGAVRNFGLMPYQKFPEDALEQIADYLYAYNPLEESRSGKRDQKKRMHSRMGQNDSDKNTLQQKAEIGLGYTLETKQLLGQNLMGAIQKEGTLHALEFCATEAIPLTQQMEEKHGASIKRVSDKNRNPNNAANEEERYYISHFQEQVDKGEDPEPITLPQGDKTRFYYPIVTNSMCLQCHGKPEKIDPKVLKKIKLFYPDDLATGYEENDVRGIWSIEL